MVHTASARSPVRCRGPGLPRQGQPPRLLLLLCLRMLHALGQAGLRLYPEEAQKGVCLVLQSMLRWTVHSKNLLH